MNGVSEHRAFGEHPHVERAVQTKLVGKFTSKQFIYLVLGVVASSKMVEFVPPLPFESKIYANSHYPIPFLILMFIAFTTHKTGMTIPGYTASLFRYKARKKTYK